MSEVARLRPPSASSNFVDYDLQVHLPTRLIAAPKCISKVARSQAPIASLYSLECGLRLYLQCRSIAASKRISKLARSQPPSLSRNPLDYSLQVHLQTHSITASKCISKFTRSWCGETLELDCRQHIINTPLHLAWHPKEFVKKNCSGLRCVGRG
jgi:hypothetical protein